MVNRSLMGGVSTERRFTSATRVSPAAPTRRGSRFGSSRCWGGQVCPSVRVATVAGRTGTTTLGARHVRCWRSGASTVGDWPATRRTWSLAPASSSSHEICRSSTARSSRPKRRPRGCTIRSTQPQFAYQHAPRSVSSAAFVWAVMKPSKPSAANASAWCLACALTPARLVPSSRPSPCSIRTRSTPQPVEISRSSVSATLPPVSRSTSARSSGSSTMPRSRSPASRTRRWSGAPRKRAIAATSTGCAVSALAGRWLGAPARSKVSPERTTSAGPSMPSSSRASSPVAASLVASASGPSRRSPTTKTLPPVGTGTMLEADHLTGTPEPLTPQCLAGRACGRPARCRPVDANGPGVGPRRVPRQPPPTARRRIP